MITYEHTNKFDFRFKVRNKLDKNSSNFWTDQEIDQSLEEALLTFGAISGFWKENITISTGENKRIYNLHNQADVVIGAEHILPSYTTQKLVDWLNKDFIENLTELNPESEFMDLNSWLKIMETVYNNFQLETGLIVGKITIDVAPNQESIQLPDELIDILRATFRFSEDSLFAEIKLNKADEEELAQNALWVFENNSTPYYYTNLYGSTNEIKLFPVPANHGSLEIIFISGSKRDLTINDSLLLPNNLIPYLKYGIEAEVFALNGPLNDPARSAYAQQRWNEGIQIGRNYASAISAKVNNRTVFIDSLESVDSYFLLEKRRSPPNILGFVGYNMFATEIIPSSEVASITLFTNANAKIPQDDADFLQIDLEYIDTLAGYVVHLLMIKAGAAETAMTSNLKDKFLKVALAHNERLKLRGITFETLSEITKQQQKSIPRVVEQNA